MGNYCCSCKRLASEEQLTLLDGRSLCTDCYAFIKSGKWCANIPFHETVFSEPKPNPPSTLAKIRGFFDGKDADINYQGKLARYKQKEQEFYSELERRKREKNTERAFYQGICDYWPKYQPPDWKYRVIGAKIRAGNICERCGKPSDLHVHHKLPRSQGGNNKPENLIVLCSQCHASEGSPGHAMIQTPRSGDPEREIKVVNELKNTALAWKSLKASSHLICSVCAKEIEKNEKHWECMGWPEDVGKTRVRRGFRGTVSRRPGEAIFIRKARAPYICKGCGKPIMEGDLYFERNFATFPVRYCQDCCYHRILCDYCDAKYFITRRYRNLVRR